MLSPTLRAAVNEVKQTMVLPKPIRRNPRRNTKKKRIRGIFGQGRWKIKAGTARVYDRRKKSRVLGAKTSRRRVKGVIEKG